MSLRVDPDLQYRQRRSEAIVAEDRLRTERRAQHDKEATDIARWQRIVLNLSILMLLAAIVLTALGY